MSDMAAPSGLGDADLRQIEDAAQYLASGGVVAFPTETVYGLGAVCEVTEAVQRIFTIKGRPVDRPLTVHVADLAAAKRYGTLTSSAQRLSALWPGPLTLVVPATPFVPAIVRAQGPTVGLRIPDHAFALALFRRVSQLRGAPTGIAAPSANPFGAPPPSTAAQVRAGLGDVPGLDLIVDGGPHSGGRASTVVDCTCDPVKILRHGALDQSVIERVLAETPVANDKK